VTAAPTAESPAALNSLHLSLLCPSTAPSPSTCITIPQQQYCTLSYNDNSSPVTLIIINGIRHQWCFTLLFLLKFRILCLSPVPPTSIDCSASPSTCITIPQQQYCSLSYNDNKALSPITLININGIRHP
jgi:hypothetical protein